MASKATPSRCHRSHRRTGLVTTHVGAVPATGPHASTASCDRPECIAAHRASIMREIGLDSTYSPDPQPRRVEETPTSDTGTSNEIAWEVGKSDAVCVVGIEGKITALDHEHGTITIAGHTLPTRLGNGVRLLSMVWPENSEDCRRDHCDDACIDGKVIERTEERGIELYAAVRAHHVTAAHAGTIGFCSDPVCAALPAGEAY